MTEMNAFERILGRLGDADTGVTEKTASAALPVTSEEAMLAAVRRVNSTTKIAAHSGAVDPVTSLEKLAASTAAREEEHLMKTAENMGAVICDGFFARMAQYDGALDHYGVKTGSVASHEEGDLEYAAQVGYQQAEQDMEKAASDAFEEGYNDTLQGIYKTAAEVHYAGQTVANALLQE